MIDPGSCASCRRWPSIPRGRSPAERSFRAGRHVRRGVSGAHALLLLRLGAPAQRGRPGARGAPGRARVGRDPRLRSEPHRPGDRVRLLLRARGDDRARVRPGCGDGQLQPRDRLHRLRHLRPAVLRAADLGGRARGGRGRAAEGRDRPVRRPDAAEARGRPGRGGRATARHERRGDRPGRGPRALRRAARAPRLQGAAVCDRVLGGRRPAEVRGGRLSAARRAPPTCSGEGRWRSSTRARGSSDYLRREGAKDGGEIFLDHFLENATEVLDACDAALLRRRGEVWIGGHHAARRGGGRALR